MTQLLILSVKKKKSHVDIIDLLSISFQRYLMSVLKIPLPDSINETLSAKELPLEAQHISVIELDLSFCLRLNPLN